MIGPTVALWIYFTAKAHLHLHIGEHAFKIRSRTVPSPNIGCVFVSYQPENNCELPIIEGVTCYIGMSDEQKSQCLQRLQIQKTEELIQLMKKRKP